MTSGRHIQHGHDAAHPQDTRAGDGASDSPIVLPQTPVIRGKRRGAVMIFMVP